MIKKQEVVVNFQNSSDLRELFSRNNENIGKTMEIKHFRMWAINQRYQVNSESSIQKKNNNKTAHSVSFYFGANPISLPFLAKNSVTKSQQTWRQQ